MTRFDYLKRSLYIIAGVIFVHFLYILKFSNRDTSTSLIWTIDIIIGGGLLIWTLTSRIIKQIRFNYNEQNITIHYLTLFEIDKTIKISFDSLNYRFDKEPSRHQPKKYSLKLFNNNRKRFTIETNRDGFSQETLEDIFKHLYEIKKPVVN